MLEQLDIDGLQLHNGSYYITELGAGLFGSPVPRTVRPDNPSQHGTLELSRYLNGRIIELKGICVGSTVADGLAKLDALKGALMIGEGNSGDYEQLGVNNGSPQHRLGFERTGDGFQQYCYVTQEGELDAPMDIVSRIIPWGVTLHASDPRLYQVDPGVGQAGYKEGTIAMDFAAQVVNDGNVESPPWITIQGPFNDWVQVEIDHADLATPHILRAELDLPDGNNVDFVVRTRLFIKNQTISHGLVDRSSTDWGGLPPGTSTLTVTNGGGDDAGTVARIRWQNTRV